MKRFLQFVMEWKTAACFMFTGTMLVFLVLCQLWGQSRVETAQLWALLLVSAAGTFVQWLCFGGRVITRMRYTRRALLFCLLFFPLLCLIAWYFQWLPDSGGAWLIFIGIFLLVFLAVTLGFEIYYRATGRKYDGLLGQYRREKEGRDE